MSFAPKRPALWAAVISTAWILVLAWPMLQGHYLVGPYSDQYAVGYAFREFGAAYLREHGAVAQWNPFMFGGLPFVAAQHGDIFYPTAWLRVVLPTDTALNVAFVSHLILAGFFTYLFLSTVGLPWLAAVVGGIGYQLTGQVASLVHPGHDGKIFASALLPLGLLALLKAVREGRWWGYGLWALTVGLAALAHPQLCYYLLIASGLFVLYLVFWDPAGPRSRRWWIPLGAALGGVALGMGVAAIQVVPFAAYIPFSPRTQAGTFSGWEYATSWSMPPEELLNVVVPQFSGLVEQYWGRNAFKLHTEYLGVPVLVLAILGWGNTERRRLRWAVGVIALFMLVVSLGGHTPLYRLLYAVFPGMKLLRAPSMAFYIVAFAVAVWAALGMERAVREPRQALRHATIWTAVLAAAAVLASAGVWTALGEAIARPERLGAVAANREALVLGTVRAFGAAAALTVTLLAVHRGAARGAGAAALVIGVVGLDLWSVDRRFFVFSPPAGELYRQDQVIATLVATPKPYRVWDVGHSYRDGSLMIFGIPDALGHHGNEVKYYDELLGGKNEWRYLRTGNRRLWRELGLTHLILPEPLELPGWRLAAGPVQTWSGAPAYLYESAEPVPYAVVIPAAISLPDAEILATFYDRRFDPARILLLPDEASPRSAPVDSLPGASTSRAEVVRWEPGRMSIRLTPPAAAPAYLRVSETFYPDWRATVDGTPAPVLRGQYALIAVPLPAGAREVELTFRSSMYRRGRLVTLASLGVVAMLLGSAWVQGRRGG